MIRQGIRENWRQFTLLVLINGLVGGMVGLERSILPEIADKEFQVATTSAILSFILVFGIVKATTNQFAGFLANRIGRKKILVAGWVFALPVPFILMLAPTWEWIIIANILLGISQGMTWSSTIIMKIDLAGSKNRGLAMGLNEFAGYAAIGLSAFVTSWIAQEYGLRPYPFYLGIGISGLGLFGSLLLIKETSLFSKKEEESSFAPILENVFKETSWKNRNLGSITQAGLVSNLNDAMLWGMYPIILASCGFSLLEIGTIVSIYPMVWGFSQLFTGKMGDHISRKFMMVTGMVLQGISICLLTVASGTFQFVTLSVLIGLGTAIVYPTFLASIADYTHPSQRAQSIGTFRFWRDMGYAFGALLAGTLADYLGIGFAMVSIGALTILSGFWLLLRMRAINPSTKAEYQ